MQQPKATLKFPLGEVSVEEKEEEEKQRMLSINGIVKGQILNGLCTAHYADEDLKLRYLYKVGPYQLLFWVFFNCTGWIAGSISVPEPENQIRRGL